MKHKHKIKYKVATRDDRAKAITKIIDCLENLQNEELWYQDNIINEYRCFIYKE